MPDRQVEVAVAIEVGDRNAVTARLAKAGVDFAELDKAHRRNLAIEPAARSRIVRITAIEVEPTVVVEVEGDQ